MSFGCTTAPHQQGIWPWDYGRDYGKARTGDYIGVTGGVAEFGDPPEVVKPVSPEALDPPGGGAPDSAVSSPKGELKSISGSDPVPTPPPSGTAPANGAYDFALRAINVAPLPYVPGEAKARKDHALTAFNHGNSPVSVVVGIDPESSESFSSDRDMPIHTVVPPHSEKVLVNLGAESKAERINLRYTYMWSIGDFAATHQNPDGYQIPFGNKVKALANVNNNRHTPLYDRYSVIFLVPIGTPVYAARKGTVVRIQPYGKIDVLHADSTIATYDHLGSVKDDVVVGRAVTPQDSIGTAGPLGAEDAYLQLTVWRPQPRPEATSGSWSPPAIDFVSLPIDFCSYGAKTCKVLTQDDFVSRSKTTEKKKGKAKARPVLR